MLPPRAEPGRNSSRAGAYYSLALLCLLGLVNYIDRVALSVLQVPLKAALGLSDAQIGTIIGFAFFVPYMILSMPMARLADRYNRKYLLVGALLVWSTLTMSIGLAASFVWLLVLRFGVAIGEAVCLPTSYSLLADYFPKSLHGRAIAILGTALPVGSMIGLVGSGILAVRIGWQHSFFVIGALGMVLAPLLISTLQEPPRSGESADAGRAPPPLGKAFAVFWHLRTLRYCLLAISFQSIVSISLLTWSAPFYVRVQDLGLANASLILGTLIGGAGGLGTLVGGLLGDRLAKRNKAWLLRLPAIASLLGLPLALGQFLVSDVRLSIGCGMAAALLANVYLAPTYAAVQSLVEPRMRAFSSAFVVTAAAIVGGAFGPWATGWASDHFAGTVSASQGLRLAICASMLAAIPSAFAYWRASANFATEAERKAEAEIDGGRRP